MESNLGINKKKYEDDSLILDIAQQAHLPGRGYMHLNMCYAHQGTYRTV